MKNSILRTIAVIFMLIFVGLATGCETESEVPFAPALRPQVLNNPVKTGGARTAKEDDLPKTEHINSLESSVPVVIDLEMSVMYADFIRETARSAEGDLKSFTLSINGQKTTAEVEITKDGKSQIVRREWSAEDADRYFENAKPQDLRAAFAKSLIRDGNGRQLPGAAYFRNAIWTCASAVEDGQAVFVQIKIDFSKNNGISGRAFVKGTNASQNVSLDERGKA